MKSIISNDNHLIKQVKKLQISSSFRKTNKLFVCESTRIIDTFITQGYIPKAIFVSKNSRFFTKYAKHDSCIEITDKVYHHLSLLENGDGTIAIFNFKKNRNIVSPQHIFIFDNLQNPSNLGSILRSAKSFKVTKIYLTNESADIYNHKVIQASMGYGFDIDIEYFNDLVTLINNLKKQGYIIYATALDKDATKLNETKFNKSAIIFGNEGKGLKENIIKLADKIIYIDISKDVDSLNLSIAASIVMYKLHNENN